jgi:hypothetical protein
MLDYLGNLVGFIVSGPSAQKLKWNGAAKAALHKGHKLSATEAGTLLASFHREWIDQLHGVRSQIIHERITLGDGGQTITLLDRGLAATLAFQLPANVVKRLKFLQAQCIHRPPPSLRFVRTEATKMSRGRQGKLEHANSDRAGARVARRTPPTACRFRHTLVASSSRRSP